MICRLEETNDTLQGKGNRELFHKTYVGLFHDVHDFPSMSTVEGWLKQAGARVRRINAKPAVSEKQKLQRIQWVYDKLKPHDDGQFTFKQPDITIWVDEKWFYLRPTVAKIRHVGDSTPQTTPMKSKRFVPKIMFLCAIAEPVGDFDGKIGIYPFTTWDVAKRDSKNRKAGTPVLVDVAVNAEVYQNVLHQVIKDASEKLKDQIEAGSKIVIQQDGARPHGMVFGKDMSNSLKRKWCRWVEVKGVFRLETQPPQSPDFNLCDLSFFWALHKASLNMDGRDYNLESMQAAVIEAFWAYDREKLSRQCAYMYSIFREILDNGGETDYKLPHEGIRNLGSKDGNFEDPSCTEELKLKAAEHISRLVKSLGSDSDTSDGETA